MACLPVANPRGVGAVGGRAVSLLDATLRLVQLIESPDEKWKDGRIGVYYGVKKGEKPPEIRVWGDQGMTDIAGPGGYEGMVQAIAEFFHTRKPPIDPAETLELFEFMTAAQLSGEQDGAEVSLEEVRK